MLSSNLVRSYTVSRIVLPHYAIKTTKIFFIFTPKPTQITIDTNFFWDLFFEFCSGVPIFFSINFEKQKLAATKRISKTYSTRNFSERMFDEIFEKNFQ